MLSECIVAIMPWTFDDFDGIVCATGPAPLD
jgi:hypothetical protein